MSEFIEECRREWKRLGVPGTIADEMADDLTADLAEAEADGATVEEVLGSGAKDPRAFAAAWATERRLVPPRRRVGFRLRWLLVGVLAFVVLLAAIVAAGLLASSSGGSSVREAVPAQVEPTKLAFRQQMVGTSIAGASVMPPRIWLQRVRTTILHHSPASVSISVLNSGQAPIGFATLIVHVAGHSYTRRTPPLDPGKVATIPIALPDGLPPDFAITARTRPVRGERVLGNNQRTWHVSIRTERPG